MTQELKAWDMTFGERMKAAMQDALMAMGATPQSAGHLAGGVNSLLGFTPLGIPMAASEAQQAMGAGSPLGVGAAALGMLPGPGKPMASAAKAAIPKSQQSLEEMIHALEVALGKNPAPLAGQIEGLRPQGAKDFKSSISAMQELTSPGPGSGTTGQIVNSMLAGNGKPKSKYNTNGAVWPEPAPEVFPAEWLAAGPSPAAVAKPKIAPVDQGVPLEAWLEKNPGGSINEYMGVANAPVQPASNWPMAEAPQGLSAWGVQVPPGNSNVQRAAPVIVDEAEALRQANREAGGYTTPVYHGTREWNVPESGKMRMVGDKFYTTPNPELAETYAGALSAGAPRPNAGYAGVEGSQVVPMWANTKDYHVADAKGQVWQDFNYKAIDEARAMRAPGVRIDNVWDELSSGPNFKGALPEPQTIYITFPDGAHTLRSPAAKFDPSKFSINDFLASLTGAGLFGGLASGAIKKDE